MSGMTAPDLPQLQQVPTPLWYGMSDLAYGLGASALAVWGVSQGAEVVSDNQRRMKIAKQMNEIMEKSLDKINEDLDQRRKSLQDCVQNTERELTQELYDMKERVEREMEFRDYKQYLNAFTAQSQNRLAVIVDFLAQGASIRWLAASVNEGLQSCVDVASLTKMISQSERPILAVQHTLALVSQWFDNCRLFMLLARHALAVDPEVPFMAVFHSIGHNFASLFKTIGHSLPDASVLRPLELPVQNFLNLVEAERLHANHSLKFPHRQGGKEGGFGDAATERFQTEWHTFGNILWARKSTLKQLVDSAVLMGQHKCIMVAGRSLLKGLTNV